MSLEGGLVGERMWVGEGVTRSRRLRRRRRRRSRRRSRRRTYWWGVLDVDYVGLAGVRCGAGVCEGMAQVGQRMAKAKAFGRTGIR